MTDQTPKRIWFEDGTPMQAGTRTARRIDTYELGLGAAAAIELEEEFPAMAVSARLHLAEIERGHNLAAA